MYLNKRGLVQSEMLKLYYKKLIFNQTENRHFDQSLFKITVF